MALYLADRTTAPTAFALAAADADGAVVLMQDGVAAAVDAPAEVPCYAIAPDVKRRGLHAALAAHVQQLSYAELVDLLVAQPVVNLG